jgi:predicted RNA polymerase sigma factor
VTDDDLHRAIAAVWWIDSARIIAVLARMVRDVGVAEELAQDTLVIALEQWPDRGVPDNPAAWLMAAGKHRALDWIRRARMLDRKHEEPGRELAVEQEIAAGDAATAWNRNSMTMSAMISFGWCSWRAIRSCRLLRASPSRSGCSVA